MKEFFYDEKGIYYKTNDFQPGRLTLVFIHGVSSSSSAWYEFEEIFGKDYNILTYDLRGHGKSLKFPKYSDYKMEAFSGDVFDLIKHVGLQKFILIGHSFGTFVAMEFMAEHRDMLLGVVLLSPGMSTAEKMSSRFLGALLGITGIYELFPVWRKTAGQVDYSKYKGTGEWSPTRLCADIYNTGLRSYLFSIRQLFYFDRDFLMPNIRIPVLIIHGEKDNYIPIRESLKMKEKISDSEHVTIKNADHILVLNNVKEVADAISKFVRKIDDASKSELNS